MNGVGHGQPGDPMYTLQSAAEHGLCMLEPIAFPSTLSGTQCVESSETSYSIGTQAPGIAIPIGIDGQDIDFALRATASHSGDRGDGGVNTSMVVEKPAEEVWNQTCGCGNKFVGPLTMKCPGCGLIREGFTHGDPVAFSAKDHGADAGSIAPTLRAGGHADSHANSGNWIGVAHSLRGEGFDASEDGTGRGTPLVPTVLAHGQGNAE